MSRLRTVVGALGLALAACGSDTGGGAETVDDAGAGDTSLGEAGPPDAGDDGSCDVGCDAAGDEPGLVSCPAGLASCDGVDPPCETDLSRSPDHCGACGHACLNEHGTTECVQGACVPTCEGAWADCDGDPDNGCETDTRSTAEHCGGCGAPCATTNSASVICSIGVCVHSCEDDFENCNGPSPGATDDGCELSINTVERCGGCFRSHACATDHSAARQCVAGQCVHTCEPGYADCNGPSPGAFDKDGCECLGTCAGDVCVPASDAGTD